MEQSAVTHKIKECEWNMMNNKTQIDTGTPHPHKPRKWFEKLQMCYKKHFPTDQASYAFRLAVVSLALSLCAMQTIVNMQWRDPAPSREYLIWAIIVLISASTYGLYHGFKIEDRRHFTPWIIFKILEIIFVAFSLFCAFIKGDYRYASQMRNVVLGFIVQAGNSYLLFTICRRKEEDPVDINENVDEFSPVISAA